MGGFIRFRCGATTHQDQRRRSLLGLRDPGRSVEADYHAGGQEHRQPGCYQSTETSDEVDGAQVAITLQHAKFFVSGDRRSLYDVEPLFEQPRYAFVP